MRPRRASPIGAALAAPALFILAGCPDDTGQERGQVAPEQTAADPPVEPERYARDFERDDRAPRGGPDLTPPWQRDLDDVEDAEQRREVEIEEVDEVDEDAPRERRAQRDRDRTEAPAREADETTMSFPVAEGTIEVVQRGPTQLRAGEPFEFLFLVTNTSDQPVHGVTLYQVFEGDAEVVLRDPAEMELERQELGTDVPAGAPRGERGTQPAGAPRDGEAQQQRGQQQDPNGHGQNPTGHEPQAGGVAHVGRLGPDETREVRLVGVARGEGALESCVTVTFVPALCTSIEVERPQLAFERLVVDAEGRQREAIYACDPFFIVYRLQNVGEIETRPTLIEEGLPEGLLADGRREIAFEVGPLEPDETIERRVRVEPERLRSAMFIGSARAISDGIEIESREMGVRMMRPELAIDVQGPSTEYAHRSLRYRVTVANPSPDPAVNVNVELRLPEAARRLTFVGERRDQRLRLEDGQVSVGRLDSGERRTFDLTFELATPGTLEVSAAAVGYCAVPAEDGVQTELVGVPAIHVEVIDLVDPVPVGQETIYEVRVTNQGTAADLDIRLEAEMPPELEFIAGDGVTPVAFEEDRVTFGPIEELAPGATVTWRVLARAQEEGRVAFRVNMVSEANPDPVIVEEPTTLFGEPR